MAEKNDANATQTLVLKQDNSKASFFDLPIELRNEVYERFCDACGAQYLDSAPASRVIIPAWEKTDEKPRPFTASYNSSIGPFKRYLSAITYLRLASSQVNLEFNPLWAATTPFAVESGKASMLEPSRFIVFLDEIPELRSLAKQVSRALSLLPQSVAQRMRHIRKSFVVSVAAHHEGLISEQFDFLQCGEGKRLCEHFVHIQDIPADFVIELCVIVRHGVERGPPEINRRAHAILTFQQLAINDRSDSKGAWVCTGTLMNGIEHEHPDCVPGEQCKQYKAPFYDPH